MSKIKLKYSKLNEDKVMKNKGIPFGKYQSCAIITGAAGGMGRIYAELLAENGYNLVLVDISGERLQKTVSEVNARVAALNDWRAEYSGGFKVLPVVQDLSEMSAASNIAEAVSGFGCDADILINNAGLFFLNEIASADRKKLSVIMMVHNYTPLMLCREFVPQMKARGHGYVLNISSLAAWMPWPAVGMYANTKRFIKAFSRSLRVECRGTGVSVTTAYFGAVDTPLYPLKPSLRKLAVRIAVMIPPEKAASKALKAMFKGRKQLMPGLINKIFLPLIAAMPDWILIPVYRIVKKHFPDL